MVLFKKVSTIFIYCEDFASRLDTRAELSVKLLQVMEEEMVVVVGTGEEEEEGMVGEGDMEEKVMVEEAAIVRSRPFSGSALRRQPLAHMHSDPVIRQCSSTSGSQVSSSRASFAFFPNTRLHCRVHIHPSTNLPQIE